MRVLMTADTVGGVWTYALELAAGLAQRGVETVLATMGAALADAQREAAERVPGLRIAESAYRLEWMDDPWDDVARAGEWLLRLRDRVQPDLVHLNGYAHGALDWGCPSWWRGTRASSPGGGRCGGRTPRPSGIATAGPSAPAWRRRTSSRRRRWRCSLRSPSTMGRSARPS